jgi:hypothetical protein
MAGKGESWLRSRSAGGRIIGLNTASGCDKTDHLLG